ncbi:SHOCT domain-containing protein [Streptomyces sp. WAC06614]|uniref:SHOCT domain-containing protein n=1 Tax=Streptomyces sp. WAC06614 TaxID=2487416 RepID=UPI000F79A488|nr:SHOCT domain-containing protein [Streptomyces sp. WAC06614]RSS78277.1 SHOCT domain-containing protein [Streptomyces sp. WAC06614]
MDGSLPLAYDYPMLSMLWTIMWVFLWVLWFFLLFRIITDIFRDHELGGWGKAGWLIFVILLPFLGVFIYVLVRGKGMSKRDMKQVEEQQAAVDDYIRRTAGAPAGGGASEVDQLAKLSDMRASGAISEEEFQRAKQKVLG